MTSTRFVLEGEWSGYTSSQRQIVHREVVTKRRAERLKSLRTIVYTDGTTLNLSLRPAEHREKVKEIKSYSSLIYDAENSGQGVYRV